MSFRNIQQNTVENGDTLSIAPSIVAMQYPSVNTYIDGKWFRNPTWPQLSNISVSDQKVIGLYAVYPNVTNFAAINITIPSGYTVNWGDGNTANYSTATTAMWNYDFNSAGLANTDGPVTFTDSTDTVNRNNHGYENGMTISFASITTTTGITTGTLYYVVNASTNSFQLSTDPNGSFIPLTNDGTGTILPYKIALIEIYPTTTGNLTGVNFQVTHSQSAGQYYTTGWLDIAISCNATTLTLGASSLTVGFNSLEQVRILKHSRANYNSLFQNLTGLCNIVEISSSLVNPNSANNTFANCRKLKTIPSFNCTSVTSTSNMFSNCFSLTEIPILNFTGALTDATAMFGFCYSLTNIPLFNTSAVTNMDSMFSNCHSLKTIPAFNTGLVTSFNATFESCYSLESIPLLNCNRVVAMPSMFGNCFNLKTVNLIDTANVANLQNTFGNCRTLQTIGNINTIKVTNMFATFVDCRSLKSIPLLNTSNVTNMQSTFSNCVSLQEIPLLNTSNVTNMSNIFGSCQSLVTVPLLNTSNVTTMATMFNGCTSLNTVPTFNTLKVANVTNMFAATTNITALPAFDLSNVSPSSNLTSFVGNASCREIKISNVYYSWSVTNNILGNIQLNEIYQNLGRVPPAAQAVTFQDTGDTVTYTDHGMANLRTVSFATITTTTGISINTNYYIRNVTANTFQLSSTPTGSIINLTNNGNGTLNGQVITVSGNWGTSNDNVSLATSRGWTVTGS